jgi:hypothetical protein
VVVVELADGALAGESIIDKRRLKALEMRVGRNAAVPLDDDEELYPVRNNQFLRYRAR